jgi:hypothetical protein
MEIRKQNSRSSSQTRAKLVRSPDGRLRSSTDETDIGDVWAEQRRIRLAEAIEEDRKKANRQHLKTERGFIGLAIHEISNAINWTKVELFGQRAVKVKAPSPTQKKTRTIESSQPNKPPAPHPQTELTRTVEIKLAMPSSFKLPKLKSAKRNQLLRSVGWKMTLKKLALGATVVAVVIAVFVGFHIWSNSRNNDVAENPTEINEHHSTTLTRGTPNYSTILPSGKSIQQLGGWARISPPDQNPVYAYADKISGIDVAVSEQPLPPNFQNNTVKQLAQLAKSVGASLKLTGNGGTTIYLGTAPQGPQSVVLSKDTGTRRPMDCLC